VRSARGFCGAAAAAAWLASGSLPALVAAGATLLPGGRPALDAHNSFPEGPWSDRLDRALVTGVRPLMLEFDLVWARGASVISHGLPLAGGEPTLEAYVVRKLGPLAERALAEGREDTWPQFFIYLEIRTSEPEHLQAIWDVLARHEAWITSAAKASSDDVQPLRAKPIIVLIDNGEAQEDAFYRRLNPGDRLRLFATAPSPPEPVFESQRARVTADAHQPAAELMPSGATNFLRWKNLQWRTVEEGGERSAGAWTAAEDQRLRNLTARAHALGLWIRFSTLNGHTAKASLGWFQGYNMGSIDAVRLRWRAAIDAGVDFISTDQYEDFAALLSR